MSTTPEVKYNGTFITAAKRLAGAAEMLLAAAMTIDETVRVTFLAGAFDEIAGSFEMIADECKKLEKTEKEIIRVPINYNPE